MNSQAARDALMLRSSLPGPSSELAHGDELIHSAWQSASCEEVSRAADLLLLDAAR